MCLVIRWHCPACNEHTGMSREFRCPPYRGCQDRQLVSRPLERDLMQEWNCENEECPYSATVERAFRTRVYAARTLSEEGDAALAVGNTNGHMEVEPPYDSSSVPEAEMARLTVSVVRPTHHHHDTVSVDSAPEEPDRRPRYPSPPPGRSSYHYDDEPYEPEEEDEDDDDDEPIPPRQTRGGRRGTSRRPQTRSFTSINHPQDPSSPASDYNADTEPEDAPSVSSSNSSIPNRPPLSRFHSFDRKRTAANWSLIKKTKRTRNDRATDISTLKNTVLKNRIQQLQQWNADHHNPGAPEWTEEECELLFLLKETLAFQTGHAMFGQDIYRDYFSYRHSSAAQPHNMIEARANILRKRGKKSGEWWIQPERRELLILGMVPN
ncbi:hypothetical protein B0T16DRAFT_491172 [Cercophora newfieldiana]|uniref:Uncharacterized protein n=1 Tax=Cercophora newfieldiana TaxID=92897 RepID=A0AA39Y981_9PEZI|nr:hypothetical protein B0T16DRAFT_491172 [Cercophora newfieldiana]